MAVARQTIMRNFIAGMVAAAALAGCTTSSNDPGFVADSSLLVINESDYTIFEIYLTEVDNPSWGPNLLGGDVLYPGEELLLGVQCDFYDALLVDEDGVECEIHSIDLCLNDADWVIRNNTCTVFEAAAKQREQAAAAKAEQKSTE